jgi:hypothetical protein
MTLVSPFTLDSVDAAYAAYCAMPHMKRASAKKPTKAQFKKLYAAKRASIDAEPIRVAKGETKGDLAQQIAEAVAAALAAANGEPEPMEAPKPKIRKRNAPPKDAARNAVLWRLNVEGLLNEALDASPGTYITQAAGTATLTAAFGPLA